MTATTVMPAELARSRTSSGLGYPGGSAATSALCSLSSTRRARDDLRRVLIRDQADRDAISSGLMRYRDGRGDDWADIIDFLTMHPEERRTAVRLLGEIGATG